jgi:hypothetical protein
MRHVYHLSGWVVMGVGVLATIAAAALSIFPSMTQGTDINSVIVSGIITAVLGGILARLTISKRDPSAPEIDLSQALLKGVPISAGTLAIAATIWPMLIAQNSALKLNAEHAHRAKPVSQQDTVGQTTAKQHSANIQALLAELSLKLEESKSPGKNPYKALGQTPKKRPPKKVAKIVRKRGKTQQQVARKQNIPQIPEQDGDLDEEKQSPVIVRQVEQQYTLKIPVSEPNPIPTPPKEIIVIATPAVEVPDIEQVPDSTTTISDTDIFTPTKIVDVTVSSAEEDLESGNFYQAEKDLAVLVDEKITDTGSESLAVASAKHNHASALAVKGDLGQASELLEDSIRIKEKLLFDKSDPLLGNGYNNLAAIYRIQKKYPQAIAMQDKAISNQITNLGEKDPRVAISYNNLARLHERSNSLVKAKYYYEQSLGILISSPTPNNPYVSVVRSNYASTLNKLNETDAAETQLKLLRILHNGLQSVEASQQSDSAAIQPESVGDTTTQ